MGLPGLGRNISARDSARPCEPHAMHGIVKNPHAKAPKLPLDSITKTEDADEAMLKKYLDEQKNPILLTLRLGKFVLLGLFLPFHFTFFKIPKLLKKHIIPYAARAINQIGSTLQQALNRLTKQMIEKLSFLKIVKTYSQKINETTAALFRKTLEPAKAAMEKVLTPPLNILKKTLEIAKARFNQTTVSLALLFSKAKAAVKPKKSSRLNLNKPLENLQTPKPSKAEQFLNKLKTAQNHLLAGLKKMPPTSLASKIAKKISAVQNMAADALKKLTTKMKAGTLSLVKPVAAFFSTQFTRVSEHVKHYAAIIQQAIVPPLVMVKNTIANFSKQVVSAVNYPFVVIKSALNQAQQFAKSFYNASIQMLKVHVLETAIKPLMNLLKRLPNNLLALSSQILKKIFSTVSNYQKQAKKHFSKALQITKEAAVKCARSVLTLPLKAFNLGKTFLQYLALLMRILWALCRYMGRELLTELRTWN